jgi:hypothetical protein
MPDTADFDPAEHGNGAIPPDRRKIALIVVVKGSRCFHVNDS